MSTTVFFAIYLVLYVLAMLGLDVTKLSTAGTVFRCAKIADADKAGANKNIADFKTALDATPDAPAPPPSLDVQIADTFQCEPGYASTGKCPLQMTANLEFVINGTIVTVANHPVVFPHAGLPPEVIAAYEAAMAAKPPAA